MSVLLDELTLWRHCDPCGVDFQGMHECPPAKPKPRVLSLSKLNEEAGELPDAEIYLAGPEYRHRLNGSLEGLKTLTLEWGSRMQTCSYCLGDQNVTVHDALMREYTELCPQCQGAGVETIALAILRPA